jgi:hypothetical protein
MSRFWRERPLTQWLWLRGPGSIVSHGLLVGSELLTASSAGVALVLIVLYITCRCSWLIPRIGILGFVTCSIVKTPLQSESLLYISRLVKTRGPHSGLLQSLSCLLHFLGCFSLPLIFFLSSVFSLVSSLLSISSISCLYWWKCFYAFSHTEWT